MLAFSRLLNLYAARNVHTISKRTSSQGRKMVTRCIQHSNLCKHTLAKFSLDSTARVHNEGIDHDEGHSDGPRCVRLRLRLRLGLSQQGRLRPAPVPRTRKVISQFAPIIYAIIVHPHSLQDVHRRPEGLLQPRPLHLPEEALLRVAVPLGRSGGGGLQRRRLPVGKDANRGL